MLNTWTYFACVNNSFIDGQLKQIYIARTQSRDWSDRLETIKLLHKAYSAKNEKYGKSQLETFRAKNDVREECTSIVSDL